mmetsp:Transcript_25881/g.65559  ORF Transcript_25881/g.65559 Transcript_25881/m.65559 type:complete len:88 (+) Transcript_25881:6897-7160(+)
MCVTATARLVLAAMGSRTVLRCTMTAACVEALMTASLFNRCGAFQQNVGEAALPIFRCCIIGSSQQLASALLSILPSPPLLSLLLVM